MWNVRKIVTYLGERNSKYLDRMKKMRIEDEEKIVYVYRPLFHCYFSDGNFIVHQVFKEFQFTFRLDA